MDLGLAIAGLISIALGISHEAVGLVWVLPGVTEERLPGTPFGPPSMTEGMIRVAWHLVTIFGLVSGGLLLMLALAPASDAKTLLLRWFAVRGIVATAMAFYVVRPRPRQMVRLPVPLLWLVVAVLCWEAST
jgi:hypothetical protein